MHIFNLII